MRFMVLLMLEATLLGCRAASHQYIVTATPLDLLNHPSHPGFCVAVDPLNAKGVWLPRRQESRVPPVSRTYDSESPCTQVTH
jgi:hypothetical protein